MTKNSFSAKIIQIVILLLLLAGCASTLDVEEGGIGGTGHADKCKEDQNDCGET